MLNLVTTAHSSVMLQVFTIASVWDIAQFPVNVRRLVGLELGRDALWMLRVMTGLRDMMN